MPPNTETPRAVLITGCSTGIGLCTAQGLAQRGYRVFATARRDEDIATLSSIKGVEALHLELRDPDSVAEVVSTVLERTEGRLYGLFNNGGYGQPGAVEDISRDVLREQFETLVFGWHDLTRAFIPCMREAGEGRIIQNSSVLGLVALPFRGAYNSAKFAIEGLTDTLRLELHGSGVHISLVEPGPVLSAFRSNAMAAFQRNVTVEGSHFQTQYEGMLARLETKGPAAPGTLPPEAVLKQVIHALEAPRPKARYYVTWPTYLFGYLRRILSTRALDRVLRKVSADELTRHR
ncbi:MAG: SDR family NAD(P)-dependent oxidoreductase [Gammaproteobacteria bacterium]